MRSDSTMIWSKLFRRRLPQSESYRSDALSIGLLRIVGRPKLTKARLMTLEELPVEAMSEEEEAILSSSSYYSCLSDFEDDGWRPENLYSHVLPQGTFGYYISKSKLRSMAKELMDTMLHHLDCQSEDAKDGYLHFGLGWTHRPDEISIETSDEEMRFLTGYWKNDLEFSDSPVLLLELMEMPWIFKQAARFVLGTEVRVHDTFVALHAQIMGMTYPTVSYWTREGKMTPRRDLRKGKARVAMVRTIFGFRQFVQWGPPYAGFSVGEGQLSKDRNSFEIVTCTQRYDGPQRCIRSVFRRT